MHVRRIVNRPAILEATRACGFSDREIAGLMGVGAVFLGECGRGERPLPAFRQVALITVVQVLLNGIGSPPTLPKSEYAPRAQAVRRSVEHWLELAIAELGTPPAKAETRGQDLAIQMLDRLEAQ